MNAKQDSIDLQRIGAGHLVACEVTRSFHRGNGDHAHPGDVVHIAPTLAGQFAQEGTVKVMRTAGAIDTIPDPDYVPPVAPATAKVRVLIPSRFHPIGEPETRDCAVGEIITVKETQATYALANGNPSVERVD